MNEKATPDEIKRIRSFLAQAGKIPGQEKIDHEIYRPCKA